VYLRFETVLACPLVLQLAPALTVAKAGVERDEPINAKPNKSTRGFFFMLEIIL
jgi:hypothetical protein